MSEINRLQRVYQLLTDSSAEKIPRDRIMEVLRFAGYMVPEKHVEELIRSSPGEEFNFEQLLNICENVKKRSITRDELQESFKKLDPDNTSYIDVGKLIQILSSGENKFNQEELDELLSILNPDGDGRICYELVIKSIFGY